ncbi:hypothetical protein SDC9_123371 [bioreactor metagenome]|uniref:Uncharacterized protein n=1 Tax=bioreactor metagenome TaxID=1076179 RepID=A0A645CHE9_9ZZZZ
METHRIDKIPLEMIIQMILRILKHILCKANNSLINDFGKLFLCIKGQARVTIKRLQMDIDVGRNVMVDGFLIKPFFTQQCGLIPNNFIQIIWKLIGIADQLAFRSFIRHQLQHRLQYPSEFIQALTMIIRQIHQTVLDLWCQLIQRNRYFI